MKNKIVTITPFYNPGEFLERCVASLITQKYDNYKMIFLDDCSTDNDNSWNKLPHNDERAVTIKNDVRKTALENLHNLIMEYCEPDDIVSLVDGDDWLISKKALSYVNDFFNEHDCWFMYGQASWTDGRKGFASAYPDEKTFSELRTGPFRVSHLRSFRAGLYQNIAKYDPELSCLKDTNGDFFKWAYDVAMVFPMMEMAGFDKVKYNNKSLYIYNRDNPLSEDKVSQQSQTAVHMEITLKPKFKQIENYK